MKYYTITSAWIFLFFGFTTWADAQPDQFNLDIKPYTYVVRINGNATEVPAELGTYDVDENRNNPKSRKIKISFVRFKCTSPVAGAPIVYLAGGPGGSGINTAGGPRHNLFMALREFGDVIALDQRGTGLSDFFNDCPPVKALPVDSAITMKELLGTMQFNARHCINEFRKNGIDVEGYNILQNGDDLEDLRKALKVPKLTLWGISFGSQLAFSFLNRHPASVDKVILAALEAPGDNIKYPEEVQDLLVRVDRLIKSDSAAHKYYPDLLGLMKTVLKKLDSMPVVVKIRNSKLNRDDQVSIGKLEVQLIVSYYLLKNPQTLRQVPLLFYNMNNGDFQLAASMVMRIKEAAVHIEPMALLTDAMTGINRERMKNILLQADTTLLGRTTNYPFPDLSEHLGLPDIGDQERKTPKSRIQGLFFSSTLDGRTFLQSAKKIVSNFPNVKHIIIENAGHDMYETSSQVQDLIVNFMRGKPVENKIVLPDVKFQLPGK